MAPPRNISPKFPPLDPLYDEKTERLESAYQALDDSYQNHQFGWDNPSSYSLQGSFQYSLKDLGDDRGLAYQGPGAKLSGGVRLDFGDHLQHAFFARPFYQFQDLRDSVSRELWVHAAGAEGAVSLDVWPEWLSFGPSLGLGMAFYQGTLPEDKINSAGFHLDLGAQACTWGRRICLGGKYELDAGMTVGDSGIVAQGGSFTAGIDLMRFWDEPSPRYVIDRAKRDAAELQASTVESIQEMSANWSNRKWLDYVASIPEDRWPFLTSPQNYPTQGFTGTAVALGALTKDDPQVLMFGEAHSGPNYLGKSSLSVFIDEVLPTLKDRYHHLVIEHFPHDIPDAEFESYRASGRWDSPDTPKLRSYIKGLRNMGQIASDMPRLLNACRELSITVHGGGYDLEAFLQNGKHASRTKLAKQVSSYSVAKVRALADTGEKVITYHGAAHNNVHPEFLQAPLENESLDELAIGADLQANYSTKEIDLILPDLMVAHLRDGYWNSYTPPGMLREYLPHLPVSGEVKLVERAPNSYGLVYPEKYGE